ncbi:RDD family protein, partial [Acetonema longum]
IYFVISELPTQRGTIGRQLTKIRVTDTNGYRLGIRRVIIRTILEFVFIFIIPGYLLIFFTQKNQGLHDYLLDTVVIMKDKIGR